MILLLISLGSGAGSEWLPTPCETGDALMLMFGPERFRLAGVEILHPALAKATQRTFVSCNWRAGCAGSFADKFHRARQLMFLLVVAEKIKPPEEWGEFHVLVNDNNLAIRAGVVIFE
jgi:hypothetical protein